MFRKFKVGLFDYDRTMVTHPYPTAGYVHASYEEECYTHLISSLAEKRHEKDVPLECTKWAVQNLKDNGAVLYVLTHEIFNLRSVIKSVTAKEVFGIENYLEVNSPEHKIDMIKAVAKIHGVKLHECLFVDDNISTVYAACEAGITGMHITSISSMWEQYILGELRRLRR